MTSMARVYKYVPIKLLYQCNYQRVLVSNKHSDTISGPWLLTVGQKQILPLLDNEDSVRNLLLRRDTQIQISAVCLDAKFY